MLRDPGGEPLTAFLRVAEAGSISEAARALGLTQSGLSRQLQKLELALGTRLLERTGAGVRLTPAGERYRAYAAEVLARREQLLRELSGAAAVPVAGELRITASTTPGEFVVPRLVASFTARHPDVQPVVFTTDSRAVVEEVLARRWDVGFVGARLGVRALRFDAVATDEVVLAVPVDHPLARRREVSLAALAGQRFVEREGGSGTILSVRAALAERGLALPPHQVTMTLSSTHAVLCAVRDGYGIGFVSSLALTDERDRRVVPVRLAGIPLRRHLYLVWEEHRLLPPVAQAFVDFTRAQGSAPHANVPPLADASR